MNKSRIEWCDYTYNPVTGCKAMCPYCYARKIARRFAFRFDGYGQDTHSIGKKCEKNELHEIDGTEGSPYPYGFDPTFHRYRLDEPQKIKKPQNIFVCSMADLFGEWVPDEWIEQVFEACEKAPWHKYLFLTKNPSRYHDLAEKELLPCRDNFWYGVTTITEKDLKHVFPMIGYNYFLSIEPYQGYIGIDEWIIDSSLKPIYKWIICGLETGPRADKITPSKSDLKNDIVETCQMKNIPLFMKNNLAPVWGEPLIQEYPWR
ncbi:MAG: phage Gp37/Gp68 family protein [Treponema sp.]|nr:phage Gp37/Gp68 family protein [Treponema sp.]